MTTAVLTIKDQCIRAVKVSGHSGYAEHGEDIVCAGISSAMMLTHTLLEDVLGIQVRTQVDNAAAEIDMELPYNIQTKTGEQAQMAMQALRLHFIQMQAQYPDYFTVLEV